MNRNSQISAIALTMVLGVFGGSAPAAAKARTSKAPKRVAKLEKGRGVQTGVASWYGPGFHGRKTANGERFNMNALTAAHRTLPLGKLVRVKNLKNGKSVTVRINDRGPYSGGRVIDLSKAAARQLGIQGLGKVSIETVGPVKKARSRSLRNSA